MRWVEGVGGNIGGGAVVILLVGLRSAVEIHFRGQTGIQKAKGSSPKCGSNAPP